MFNEILKFGNMIVDALRTYNHPVFISVTCRPTVSSAVALVFLAIE